MTRIQVLSQDLINQIAAGEVIERPASVVKELIENALDAGATALFLEISGSGIDLIRCVDNGCGMDREELEIAILRHATSKISSLDDLHSIRSLGFRGEALPSILSVSRSVIASRKSSSPHGYGLTIEADRVIERGIKGMPAGTVVEVKDLFFNTPARKKFLKTAATEQRAIIDVVSRYALAYQAVRFTLVMNGRTVLNLHKAGSLQERAGSVLGKDLTEKFRDIHHEKPGIRLYGILGLPSVSRPTRAGIYSYVNARSVRDYTISSAIVEGYRGLLMKGKFPVSVLFVEIDPSDVDVNVHPAKAEVRFKHPSAVFGFIVSTVREALSTPAEGRYTDSAGMRGSLQVRERGFHPDAVPPPVFVQEEMLFAGGGEAETTGQAYAEKQVIGVLFSTYILLQDASSFYVLDQHAAHERINYERLKMIHGEADSRSQMLLHPIVLELSSAEYAAFDEIRDHTQAIGIECSPFGDRTLAVRSVPPLLANGDIKGIMLDLIHAVLSGSFSRTEYMDEIMASIACHRSVTSGTHLAAEEIRTLLEDLDKAGSPQTCPHGRPLYKRISKAEIERWLGRRP
ncbi:MAG: DNA mismatch repair endonuclease MutL [Desulfomonilia bacterium]